MAQSHRTNITGYFTILPRDGRTVGACLTALVLWSAKA